MTPSDNSFTISPHNLALLHSTLLHSYPVPLKDGAATLNDSFVLLSATLCSHEVVFNLGNHGGLVVIELLALDVFQEKPEKKYKEKNNIRLFMDDLGLIHTENLTITV